jgi:hypothetical protein
MRIANQIRDMDVEKCLIDRNVRNKDVQRGIIDIYG